MDEENEDEKLIIDIEKEEGLRVLEVIDIEEGMKEYIDKEIEKEKEKERLIEDNG